MWQYNKLKSCIFISFTYTKMYQKEQNRPRTRTATNSALAVCCSVCTCIHKKPVLLFRRFLLIHGAYMNMEQNHKFCFCRYTDTNPTDNRCSLLVTHFRMPLSKTICNITAVTLFVQLYEIQ